MREIPPNLQKASGNDLDQDTKNGTVSYLKMAFWLRSAQNSFWAAMSASRATVFLMLSCFSRVWLFATPQTVECQAPLSMGFSRQEYWSGLPFPSPRIFPTQRSNPCLLCLLHSGCFWPLVPLGSPKMQAYQHFKGEDYRNLFLAITIF